MVRQARLPIRLGGLGLTSAVDTAPAARAAMLVESLQRVQDLAYIRELMRGLHGQEDLQTKEQDKGRAAFGVYWAQVRAAQAAIVNRSSQPAGPDHRRQQAPDDAVVAGGGEAAKSDEASQGRGHNGRGPKKRRRGPPHANGSVIPPPGEPFRPMEAQANATNMVPQTWEELAKATRGDSAKREAQKVLTQAKHNLDLVSAYTQQENLVLRARMLSQTQEGAGEFLLAVPMERELEIPPEPFRWALRHRLLSTAVQEEDAARFVCRCGAKAPGADKMAIGEHALNCKDGGEHIHRHDAVVDVMADMLRAAGLRVEKEPRGLFDGIPKQGGPDLLVESGYPVGKGKAAAFDVKITNPSQVAHVAQAAKMVLHTARAGEREKQKKYAGLTKAHRQCALIPLVMETTGALGPQFMSAVTKISILAATADTENGDAPGAATSEYAQTVWCAGSFKKLYMQRIGAALVRGNYAVRQATRLGRQGRQWSWRGKRKEEKQCQPKAGAMAPLKTAKIASQRGNHAMPKSTGLKVFVAVSDSGESVRSVRHLHNEPRRQRQANLNAPEPGRVQVVLRKEGAKSGNTTSGSWSARSVHLASEVGGDQQAFARQHPAPAFVVSRGRAGCKDAARLGTAAKPGSRGRGWRAHSAGRRRTLVATTTAAGGGAKAVPHQPGPPLPSGVEIGRGARAVDEAIMMDLVCATEDVDLERSGASKPAPTSSIGETASGQGVVGDVLDLNCGDDFFSEESSTPLN